MADPTTTLSELSTSLTALEEALAPLLATPFEEVSEGLEPLVKARLDVMVGYVVHDLIWIYLKSTGIEPSTHPVMQELERLKAYFDKLKSASGKKDGPRFTIDKAAAGRFIAAAIASGTAKVDPFYTPAEAGPSGTHTRFDEQADKLLEEKEGSEEEVEEEVVVEKVEEQSAKMGKKGRKLDPFAGYDSPKAKTDSPKGKAAKGGKKEKRGREEPAAAVEGGERALSKKQLKKLAFKKAKTGVEE